MRQHRDHPRFLRALLAPLSVAYRGVISARNRHYDRGGSATHASGVPVISVGNLTVGGTGKTPLTIEIVRRLLAAGRRPAILTRGYAAARGQIADEVREFKLAVPAVAVVVDGDRVAGAAVARREHGADCLVLDDGFQHRRLRRDLDVVLIDALDPWGGGWVLPAGRLREPLTSLRRANWIVVTRTNQVPPAWTQEIIDTARRYAPGVPISKAAVAAGELVDLTGRVARPDTLAQQAVLPVCGIGNPETFAQLVEDLGGRACELLGFPDHHRYGPNDAKLIMAAAQRCGARWVVTTRKDWVKLREYWPSPEEGAGAVELLRLDARLVLADPRGEFDARLRRLFEEPA